MKMLRRKPTRLELKLDDTEEFESVKKELEVKSRRSSITASQDWMFRRCFRYKLVSRKEQVNSSHIYLNSALYVQIVLKQLHINKV